MGRIAYGGNRISTQIIVSLSRAVTIFAADGGLEGNPSCVSDVMGEPGIIHIYNRDYPTSYACWAICAIRIG